MVVLYYQDLVAIFFVFDIDSLLRRSLRKSTVSSVVATLVVKNVCPILIAHTGVSSAAVVRHRTVSNLPEQDMGKEQQK